MLANTVHSYPAFYIGGPIGIVLSMAVEITALLFYLRRIRNPMWIFSRFAVANVLSALAGIPIFVTTDHLPSGIQENLVSLTLGVSIAFLVTVYIESVVFRFGCPRDQHRVLVGAVVRSNFLSYAALVALYLILI